MRPVNCRKAAASQGPQKARLHLVHDASWPLASELAPPSLWIHPTSWIKSQTPKVSFPSLRLRIALIRRASQRSPLSSQHPTSPPGDAAAYLGQLICRWVVRNHHISLGFQELTQWASHVSAATPERPEVRTRYKANRQRSFTDTTQN